MAQPVQEKENMNNSKNRVKRRRDKKCCLNSAPEAVSKGLVILVGFSDVGHIVRAFGK
jgi:hypothetical protein